MILNKLEDFTNAILRGEEINHETVFYTGILDDVTENGSDNKSPHLQIGDLYKDGIYIGSYNGKDVVMALKDEGKYTFDEAMDLEDKRPLSLLEWLLYLENKKIIDKKIKKHGGEPLKDDYYWSSSEYYGYTAWVVSPSDGDMYGYSKNGSNRVRCVLAF
jgi:hypothetical protein|nr:MAG TPA: Protein of unknown function (DUF1566) [Caudoviricetes sp.]